MADPKISFDPRGAINSGGRDYTIIRLDSLPGAGFPDPGSFPYSIRILVENVLRNAWQGRADESDLNAVLKWQPRMETPVSVPYFPARVILQDFTGVPALVDLAALRSAVARAGGDPARVNPVVPADLVIDHSVQVDKYGTAAAFQYNVDREMERNRERYSLLRWGQSAFDNFRVVPPGTGIVHQVNLEYLGSVVRTGNAGGELLAFPDTLVGTDSHTPMINGLGILGWGVGGIEAEAVLLGEPYHMLLPEVVGVELKGQMPEGTTATDLVLLITQKLRERGVVGKFVEFFGPSLSSLSLPDRATIANMSPEYGATMTYFPVDSETLSYMARSGRSDDAIDLVEKYCRQQRLFHHSGAQKPEYTNLVTVDLGAVEMSVSGPRKPHERVPVADLKDSFIRLLPEMLESGLVSDADSFESCGLWTEEGGSAEDAAKACSCPVIPRTECLCTDLTDDSGSASLSDGSVVIAAITSCTNTSNPMVMMGAGLVAQKAAQRGLKTKPWVKTSLAPGSKIVSDYLDAAGLTEYLDLLGFYLVGYGCTTCIGNSGPLDREISERIEKNQLLTAAVLSGNRNYEARINPLVRANYLASPMLVVAYALAGTVHIDLTTEPICQDPEGEPVYLHQLWPAREEVEEYVSKFVRTDMFASQYAKIFKGDRQWQEMPVPAADQFDWNICSTYIKEPPFFRELSKEPGPVPAITGARILAIFGDTLTTDHISPAGVIAEDIPAGRYLKELGVAAGEFNSFGSRRGNHEVMMRGTFGNVSIRNLMTHREGGWTIRQPDGEEVTIYDAAMSYRDEGVPLVVLGGQEYGAGSSRDWAAKGTMLLGVRAVIASSYERIHRSNLVGMGVLPLQFREGQGPDTLGLNGSETLEITGLDDNVAPGAVLGVRAERAGGGKVEFEVSARLDNATDVEYYRHGGILNKVLRTLLAEE
jgi:aconitate hydratase